jgi:hypothetical protein
MGVVAIDVVEKRAALLPGLAEEGAGGVGQFGGVAADGVACDIDAELFRRLVVSVLAVHRDEVSGVVQLLVEGAHPGFDGEETHGAVAMRVEPGLHDLAHRLADGHGRIRVLEAQALRGETVDVGRQVLDRPAADAAGVEVHVVRGEEQDVERRRGERGAQGQQCGQEGGREEVFHGGGSFCDGRSEKQKAALADGPFAVFRERLPGVTGADHGLEVLAIVHGAAGGEDGW